MNTKSSAFWRPGPRTEPTWKAGYRRQHLATALGVSRTLLREVLARREVDEMVRVFGNGGYVVSDLRQELADAYDRRAALEGKAARLAAQRADGMQLRVLRSNVEASECVPYVDREARAHLNLEFHQLLANASQSPKIVHGFNNVHDLILTDGDVSLHLMRAVDLGVAHIRVAQRERLNMSQQFSRSNSE